jgi:thiamine biosynthesis lipoprotein
MRRKLSALALAFVAILSVTTIFVGCNRQAPYRTCEGIVWGTTYRVTYASRSVLEDSIRVAMHDVDNSVSMFNAESVVSAINRGDTTVVADSILRRVFLESQRISALSHGAFDPTVGPLVDLWGFGPSNASRDDLAEAPSQEQIDSMRALVGIADCRLLPNGKILKKHPGTRFDFSAIAKGYACDLVADMFERNGVTDYLIEIGGEIRVGGTNPQDREWRVMIDAPIVNNDSIIHDGMAVISITGEAVATSGNYRNYHKAGSSHVSHTISPITGRPVSIVATDTTTGKTSVAGGKSSSVDGKVTVRVGEVLSATVIAPNCITADALATACMVMPLDSARAMLNAIPDVAGLFVTVDADGNWELHPTRTFPHLDR